MGNFSGSAATSVITTSDSELFRFSKLYFFALLIMIVAEFIGSASFSIGPGKVVLLPMIWALLMGAVLGLMKDRVPGSLRIETGMQFSAAAILQPALLLFVAIDPARISFYAA